MERKEGRKGTKKRKKTNLKRYFFEGKKERNRGNTSLICGEDTKII